MRLFAVVLGCVPFLLAGCSSTGGPGAAVAASQTCRPGEAISCTGPGACAGGQTCKDTGEGFNDCICGASGSDGGTAPDGPSGSDGAPPPDGPSAEDATSDAPIDPSCGVSCDDSNACTTDSCVSAKCVHTALPNGTVCTGGTCENTVCTPCGGEFQACCPGSTCNNAVLVCNGTTPKCNPTCGAAGMKACTTGKPCPFGDAYFQLPDMCVSCGHFGEACCPKAPLCQPTLNCNPVPNAPNNCV